MSKMIIVEGNSNDKNNVRAFMVKGEKGEKGDNGEILYSDVIDNLNSTETQKPLSAKQGKILKSLTDQKPYYFNNVADMKAYNLQAGDMAITLGYYTANDGGGAKYKITNTESQTDYQEELDNGLYATLVVELPLKVEQLGAKGDGTTDDTTIIQTALNKYNDLLMEKEYKVSEIIINRSDIHLKFNKIKGSIKINATELVQLVDVQGNRLINESGIGLYLVSNSGNGIQYCRFSIGLIRANECVKFDSSSGGWINQNYFYKTNVSYGTGITSAALSGIASYNGNIFENFGFEGLTKWFNLKSFSETLFEKCRMIPHEADGQGSTIRELGVLENSKTITFNNKTHGTYYEMITFTNSIGIVLTGKVMSAGGTKDAIHMKIRTGGVIDLVEFDTPIYMANMSDLTGTTIIEIYNYNVGKPIIFNYDESKYTWVNLRIPDAIASALKYIDVVVKGTSANGLDITRNNTLLKSIASGTSDETFRIYF